MKKALIFIVFFTFLNVANVNAQSLTTTSYSIGIPTGDMGDFVSNVSWRGFSVDYRKLVQSNIGIGISSGLNTFYEERPFGVYTIDNRSLSGKQWRYSNNVPIMVSGDYFFKPGEPLNPFIGLGVGTIYTLRTTDMGIYRLDQKAWSFAFQPQVGLIHMLNNYAGISLSAKYSYGLAAGDLSGAQSFLSLNIGYVFMGN
ncbi:OmpW family protein [Pararhodonellum marinum]|uniref:OmpW family protein n=1 Tax=Pararhodonellum marinum TaxID=2755358 RepID=UPI00188F51C4|nr:OmpW family protein [Pararhodonellum marinum]